MPLRASADRRFFITAILPLLILVIIKGVFFAALMPAWSGDDEQAYWADIKTVVGEDRVFMEREATHHGRLYPAMAAPIYLASSPLGLKGQLLSVRLLGCLFYALVVYFTYLAARTIWPRSRFIQTLAPVIVAFNPKLSFVMASVNTEILLILAFSAATAGLSGLIIRPSLSKTLLVITALAVGTWTKDRFLVAFPLTVIGLLIAFFPPAYHRISNRVLKQKQWLVAGGIGAAAALWLLIPKITGFVQIRAGDYGAAAIAYDPKIISLWRQPHFYEKMFRQFWGFFVTPFGIELSNFIYFMLWLLVVASSVGLVFRAYLAITSVAKVTSEPTDSARPRTALQISTITTEQWRAVVAIFLQAAIFLMIMQAVGVYELLRQGGLGRYLMMGSLPVALLMAAGLEALTPRLFRGPILWSICGAMLTINILSITAVLMPVIY